MGEPEPVPRAVHVCTAEQRPREGGSGCGVDAELNGGVLDAGHDHVTEWGVIQTYMRCCVDIAQSASLENTLFHVAVGGVVGRAGGSRRRHDHVHAQTRDICAIQGM